MTGEMPRQGSSARVSLPAAAGLLTGLGLGLLVCVAVVGMPSLPAVAPAHSPAAPSAPAEAPALFPAAPPARLVGLKGSAVRQTFGEPEMRRREPPAEVWQYRTPSCVLDLYFYGDPDGEGVIHFESRPRDSRRASHPLPPDGCIGELAARRRPLI